MDIRCPFCSQSLFAPPGALEVECSSCRAVFDVEAARILEENQGHPASADPGDGREVRRAATEAWIREDRDTETGERQENRVVGVGKASPEAEARSGETSLRPRSTEAYLRPIQEERGATTYRYSGKDLRYAEEEIFVPPNRMAQEPASPRDGKVHYAKPGEARPKPTPPSRRPTDRVFDIPPIRPAQGVPSPSPRGGVPPPEVPIAVRRAEGAKRTVAEDEGPAQVVRRAEPGPSGPTALGPLEEPVETPREAHAPLSATPADDPFKTLDEEPGFDRFSWVGPEFGATSGPIGSAPQPESARTDERLPPRASVETRKESFAFSDLDWKADSGHGFAPEGARTPKPETGDLDISFDDLAFTEAQEGTREPGNAALLDIESVLKEESEPDMTMPWVGEENGGVPQRAGPVGASRGIHRTPETGIALPDQWLDLPAGGSADAVAYEDHTPGLSLEGFPQERGALRGAERGLEPGPTLGIREPPVVPVIEPAISNRQSAERVREVPRARWAATGLRWTLLGAFLVVLIGVILGQTEYGYFGINLFVPSEEARHVRRRAVPPMGSMGGIAKDTPEAYQNEIVRIENLLREDPDNARAKADLLEVMMRFRERFPAVVGSDEKWERRLKQLESEAQVNGQKASMVRVLDLVNAGQFAEARAVLDGMVVATAEDADVLYFYGKIALGQEKFEEAQRYFELALLKDPGSIAAKYFLARTRIAQGKTDEGRRLLEEILEQEPGHLPSKVLLARMALDKRDIEAASRLAGEVLTKADSKVHGDDLFDAHLVLAAVREAQGNAEERISELRAALTIRPSHQETAVTLARLLLAGNKQEEAVAVLEPCWNAGCDSLAFLTTYLEAVLAAGQERRAEEVMTRGTEKYPNSPDFAIIQGRHFLGLGKSRAAVAAFETAIRAAPDTTEAYLLLAEALVKDGKVTEAIRRLEEGAGKVRDRIPLLHRKASLHREIRDFVAAEETFREVLVMDPSNMEVQKQLGLVVLALGRAEEAVAVLGALHARQGLDREGVLGLARAYRTLRRPEKAREVLSRVYGQSEEDVEVATEYAYALTESGQLREAEEVLKKVLQNRSSYAAAHHAMGRVYWSRGETKAAVEAFVRAVQIDPREPQYRLDMARALKKQGTEESLRDALKQLDQVVEAYDRGDVPRDQRKADAYVLRGEILFSQQKYALAMKDFEAALSLEPARMDILVGFGRTLFELARYEEAAPYFKQVLSRDRSHPEANFYMGRILVRNGDVEGAKALLERVAQRSPERFPEALRLLGMIYRDQNLKPLARKTFAAYLQYAPKGTAEAEEVRRILDRMR